MPLALGENHLDIITHNRERYVQYPDGIIIELSEYLRGLPSIEEYNQLTPDVQTRLNTRDTAHTCQYCRTAFRISDQRDPDRCPYCWRLI